MPKVLVSPGYGAGWSTWSDKSKEVAEYKPIIDFIEKRNDPSRLNEDHPLVKQMIEDLNLDYFYCGGAKNLMVVDVDGKYRIEEYDGSELIRTSVDFW